MSELTRHGIGKFFFTFRVHCAGDHDRKGIRNLVKVITY